jgi:hypothetical protein
VADVAEQGIPGAGGHARGAAFPFANFDTDSLDWDTYRRSYMSIWPTNDVVGAPLDVAFYDAAFEGCAKPGHCVGLSTLAITIWQLGGWFGFSSPASFYAGPPDTYPHPGPESDDLRKAVHILHARQFDAGNVQDVLQTVKAGHLNDGMAAYDRVFDGLASGDLQVVSISDGLSDGHAHCLLPYRCETLASGERDLYVWDSVRPYVLYPDYYNSGYNRIRINGPTDWTYDPPSTTDTSTRVSTTAGCSPSPPPPSATRGASPSASATSCRISPTSC